MPSVEHGVVKPPNEPGPKGGRVNNGSVPLTRQASTVHHDQIGHGADRRDNSFMSLSGAKSPVKPPDHRFRPGMAKMPQPPSAVTPGRGAIPVRAFGKNGLPNTSATLKDNVRGGK
jgi:hypothetical protein